MTPRIPPLPPEEQDDRARELLGGVRIDAPASNIFTTLVRNPGLYAKWLPFGGKLLAGKLPPREREKYWYAVIAHAGVGSAAASP